MKGSRFVAAAIAALALSAVVPAAASAAPPDVSVIGGSCGGELLKYSMLRLRITDDVLLPADLRVTATTSNSQVVPFWALSVVRNGSTHELRLLPLVGPPGTAVVTLRASDGDEVTEVPITVRVGNAAGNTLTGTGGIDMLYGGVGGDTLDGLGSADLLCGGFGDDVLRGGDGDDVLEGSFGADQLIAGDGDDQLTGGLGIDRFDGGDGDDDLRDVSVFDRVVSD